MTNFVKNIENIKFYVIIFIKLLFKSYNKKEVIYMQKSTNTEKTEIIINNKNYVNTKIIDVKKFNEEVNEEIDEDFELTDEDIQHLLKSEEDIRMGRTYTLEEVKQHFKEKYGVNFDEV